MTETPTETTLAKKKHVLSKVPRAWLYSLALVAALLFVGGVVAEIMSPGAVARVAAATDTVAVQTGAILASIALVTGPVLSLLNLDDD